MEKSKRLQVILDQETAAILGALKKNQDLPNAAVIRRAVKMFSYALEVQRAGGSLAALDKNGKVERRLTVY